MLKADALAHFGLHSDIARALQPHWSTAAVYLWGEIVPLAAARKLAEVSGGKLVVVEELYDAKGNITQAAKKKHKSRRKRAA